MSNLTKPSSVKGTQTQPGCSPIFVTSLIFGIATLGIIMQAVALKFSVLFALAIALAWGFISLSLLVAIYGPEFIRVPVLELFGDWRLSDKVLTVLLTSIFATSVFTAVSSVGALYQISILEQEIVTQRSIVSPTPMSAQGAITYTASAPTPASTLVANQPISTTTPFSMTATPTSEIPTRQPRMLLPWTSSTIIPATETPSVQRPSPSMDTAQNPVFSRVTIAGVNRSSGSSRASLAEEYVVLLNFGDTVDLTNWILTVADGKNYIFPNAQIEANEIVRIHTGVGINTNTDLYWGQTISLFRDSGGSIILRNQSGTIVDQFHP